MGYVGNQSTNSYSSMVKQDLTGASGASVTLSHPVANANEVELYINNVRQEPTTSYTTNGTTLNFVGYTVAASDDIYVIFSGKALQTVVPPDGSVSTAKIADDAVNLTSKVTGVLPVANGGTGHNAVIAFACKANKTSSGDESIQGDIVFNQVQTNVGNAYNNSNGRFTAPVAGTYFFTFHALTASSGTQQLASGTALNGYFKKNGADAGFGKIYSQISAASHANVSASMVITLAQNDYIQVHIADNYIYSSQGANYNQFSGHLIGVA